MTMMISIIYVIALLVLFLGIMYSFRFLPDSISEMDQIRIDAMFSVINEDK